MKLALMNMLALTIGFSGLAQADDVKVEKTSFQYVDNKNRVAEYCGKVTGATNFPVMVKVTVDPNDEKPGVYNVTVGSDQKFCVVVVSYTGTASVSLW